MAAEKLEERHLETANLVACCDELASVLDSGEPVFKEVKKLSDITSNVTEKVNKTKDAIIHTAQSKCNLAISFITTLFSEYCSRCNFSATKNNHTSTWHIANSQNKYVWTALMPY